MLRNGIFHRPLKPKVGIYDQLFSHLKVSCSCYRNVTPTNFVWDRKAKGQLAFFTDNSLAEAKRTVKNRKVAWLLESPAVIPDALDYITNHFDDFDFVLTHQRSLLELDPRVKFYPLGGCWIKDQYWRIYDKNKLVSLVASQKQELAGHKLRHLAAEKFQNVLDLYGRGYREIRHKIDAHRDYMFTIVIENCRSDCYFSEKLIDALACGCMPIYWGCPSIADFFDARGILSFESIEELPEILQGLSRERYEAHLPYLRANFETAKQYKLTEDYLWENFKAEIFDPVLI